jgi:tetratricopeptide (TPR) repeat protein
VTATTDKVDRAAVDLHGCGTGVYRDDAQGTADMHVWITGGEQVDRIAAADSYAPGTSVTCHRRLRGPYTGVGALMRARVPEIMAYDPDLVRAHAVEILSVAPELECLIGAVPGTLTDTAPRQERTRWYSTLRTRRIAHGLVDLTRAVYRECATTEGGQPATIVFHRVDEADATDLEFLTLAVSRLDHASVRIVVCSPGTEFDRGDVGVALRDALRSRATHVTASHVTAIPAGEPAVAGQLTVESAAAAFVDSDCTDENPTLAEGYLRVAPEIRARLHDERADALIAAGEQSWRYGAIPYHRALGATGVDRYPVFRDAINYCMGLAFYDAGLELTERLLTLVDADTELAAYHEAQLFRANLLVLLQRPDEVESIYFDLLERTADPATHMSTAYAIAMLYTRMYRPELKDHHRAAAWVNTAIALASQISDEKERAFRLAFMLNGKALVVMHLGRLDESLRLVDKGIDLMRQGLPDDVHHLHRSVLRHNRAQVYTALGRFDEALADYDHIVSVDPAYPEFRFDRGNLLNRMGHHAEALADYEYASRLGPPFPELWYNIADLRATMGDVPGAMRGMSYVLDLEPDHIDARVALAALCQESGDAQGAAEMARSGLTHTPHEPRLHVALALALIALDRPDDAAAACDRALALDPAMVAALTNRAVARFTCGRYEGAIGDLTAALALEPANADILYNRGYVHQAAGSHADAVDDYDRALALPGVDRDETLRRRAECQAAMDGSVRSEAAPDETARDDLDLARR